jgi:electron transfer flavoprotein beta subunit
VADNGFKITDPNLKGSDAFITLKILSLGIKKIVRDDDFIIFCGLKSSDGETSVVPSEIASNLQIPSLTLAKTVEIKDDSITVKKETSSEKIEIQIKKPCVISFDVSSIPLRIISIKNRLKSKSFKPVVFSLKDFDIKDYDGLKESPTEVIDIKELKSEQTRNPKTINLNDENDLSEIKKVIYE